MQAFKVILVVACLAGIASAASWSQISDHCEHCRKLKEEIQKWSTKVDHDSSTTEKNQEEGIASNEMKVVPKGAITKHLCEKTNLCQRESPLFNLNQKSQGDDMNCDECKEYYDKVKKNLSGLEKAWIELCKQIPSEEKQQECLEDEKTTVDYISKHTSEEVCQHDGLCPPKRPFFDLGPLQKSMCSLLCEPCKQIAQQLKAGAPQAKDQLKKMCKNCGAPDNVKKCEKAIDKFIENIEKKSPEELCIEIGLCKKQ